MTSLAHTVLQDAFGYAHFRGSQQAIVDHVIGGDDALVLMPTGGGKSLCYQIPAIVRQQQGHGTTIVISPLIALMHDQVSAMHEIGVDAAFLNSTLDYDQTRDVELQLLSGGITLLYVAPERLNTPRFLGLLDELHAMGKLALFAIDEAHCVSQWGHDFRPEYRELTVLHQRYAGVPRIALTATADALTRADIVERMQLESARVFISSFDRANIRYTIVEKKDASAQLLRFIEREHDGDAGVVYCLSRKKVEEVAQTLCDAGVNALPYHAGLGAELRQKNQSRFLREEGIVMVATIAFGMGINKPDVRFVAHVDMPKNIESYYQETGRGGRDGLPADAWMAYGYRDVVSQRSMIDESPAGDAFKQVMRGKLDALLGLAEGTDCRRVRLLAYFDEVYGQGGDYDSAHPEASAASAEKAPRYQCGNCDNCLNPPKTWDGTDAARKLLSTIYRAHAASQVTFGATHILDIVRGKETDKVRQFSHQQLSTFGLCQDYTEPQLRGVLRQLLAIGALATQKMQTEAGYSFETLVLCDGSRAVLRGEQTVELRESTAERSPSKRQRSAKPAVAAQNLGPDEQVRFINLKAWRTEVAKEHNVPAYVVFADATLAAIAQRNPQSLDELQGVSGIGVKKLEAYGEAVLRVCNSS